MISSSVRITLGTLLYLFVAFLTFSLWVLGLATRHTMGGFIHIFLVLAVLIILMRALGDGSNDGVYTPAHLQRTVRRLSLSNIIAMLVLTFGLCSFILGVNEMNSVGIGHVGTVSLFVAGIIGTSVGLTGLTRRQRQH